jgi:hypothetical protein
VYDFPNTESIHKLKVTSENGSSVNSGSRQKLKMDLSHVSFLKPHVINPEVYKLSHKGHETANLRKSEVVKLIE